MAEPILTGEFVRRYMTAVGAAPSALALVMDLLIEMSVEDVLDEILTALDAFGGDEVELAVRLARCADADRLLTRADEIDAHSDSETYRAVAAELRSEARGFLVSVDVSPARWEEARRG